MRIFENKFIVSQVYDFNYRFCFESREQRKCKEFPTKIHLPHFYLSRMRVMRKLVAEVTSVININYSRK